MTGQISVMFASKGDVKTKWDSDVPEEVEAARKTFNELTKKGYAAFKMDGGARGSQIREFNPNLESIVMVPPMKGG